MAIQTREQAEMDRWRTQLQPLDDILGRTNQAGAVLDTMCKHGRLRMCIPPQRDDSDVIIADVLNQIPLLIARIRQLEKRPLSEEEIAAIRVRHDAVRPTT